MRLGLHEEVTLNLYLPELGGKILKWRFKAAFKSASFSLAATLTELAKCSPVCALPLRPLDLLQRVAAVSASPAQFVVATILIVSAALLAANGILFYKVDEHSWNPPFNTLFITWTSGYLLSLRLRELRDYSWIALNATALSLAKYK